MACTGAISSRAQTGPCLHPQTSFAPSGREIQCPSSSHLDCPTVRRIAAVTAPPRHASSKVPMEMGQTLFHTVPIHPVSIQRQSRGHFPSRTPSTQKKPTPGESLYKQGLSIVSGMTHYQSYTPRGSLLILLPALLLLLPANASTQAQEGRSPKGTSSQGRGSSGGTSKWGRRSTREESSDSWDLIVPPGGGYCLDGSLPAYYLRQGQGSGKKNWIFYLQGGGWCFNWRECEYRSQTGLGTSRSLPQPTSSDSAWEDSLSSSGFSDSASVMTDSRGAPWGGGGLLSANKTDNPAFHNWNVAVVMYCDGGAHLGTRGSASERGGTLVFDGIKGLQQIVTHMMGDQGMDSAENVLVSGCSAGGHSVGVLCDWIVGQLSPGTRAKCLMDAGFFMDFPDEKGKRFFRGQLRALHDLQKAGVHTPVECLNKYPTRPWRCLFPENTLPFVKTPMFVVNNVYDYVALDVVYHHKGARHTIPGEDIMKCIDTGEGCSKDDRRAYKRYGTQMRLKVRNALQNKPQRTSSWFLMEDSDHCQVGSEAWSTKSVNGRSMRHAVASWFFQPMATPHSPENPGANSGSLEQTQVPAQGAQQGVSSTGPSTDWKGTIGNQNASSLSSGLPLSPPEGGGMFGPFADPFRRSGQRQVLIHSVLLTASAVLVGLAWLA